VCDYTARHKVVSRDGERVSPIYCRAHADDYVRQAGGRVVTPRIVIDTGPLRCAGNWPLPASVP